MKRILYLVAILSVGLISACKKDKVTSTTNSNKPPATGTALDFMKDSLFLYAKEDYLWNDAIPDYGTFNPRSYTGSSDLTALTNELNAITQLKINPATGKPFEYYSADPGQAKYAFIDDGTTTSGLNGTNGDLGLAPKYSAVDTICIRNVNPNSPAALAGIKRGYRVIKINDRDVASSLQATNDAAGDANVNFVVNAFYYSDQITLTLLTPGGSTITKTLNKALYTANPVITYKVFDQGAGHKVGYFVFDAFTSSDNANPKLDEAFNYFISNGVNELVVDLRYNGGGYGLTSEYLANLIVPASKTGSVMYTNYFNSNLQNDNYPLLSKIYQINKGDFLPANNTAKFNKQKTLNLSRVFFLVTGSTASASELTINSLRPALNVQIIGTTTYGKPVGDLTIPLNNDKYEIYLPMITVKNSAGQGDYYAGMEPGTATYPGKKTNDDITRDFGDPNEGLLKTALNYITTGIYVADKTQQSLRTLSIDQTRALEIKMNKHLYRGLISNKKLKLKNNVK